MGYECMSICEHGRRTCKSYLQMLMTSHSPIWDDISYRPLGQKKRKKKIQRNRRIHVHTQARTHTHAFAVKGKYLITNGSKTEGNLKEMLR